jgi:hypothetical protein
MNSATTPKTIRLGGCGIQREAVAAVAITPGMLVAINGDGEAIPHATADQETQPAFAVEYALTGRGIDDAYAIGDNVIYEVLPQGAMVYATLAANQTITKGEKLTSDGAGRLKTAADTSFVIAEAREDVTTTGDPGRVKCEVLTGRGIA